MNSENLNEYTSVGPKQFIRPSQCPFKLLTKSERRKLSFHLFSSFRSYYFCSCFGAQKLKGLCKHQGLQLFGFIQMKSRGGKRQEFRKSFMGDSKSQHSLLFKHPIQLSDQA